MKHEAIIEILDFLNSIEGAGYGGMASFEIAREHMRHAYRQSLAKKVRDEHAQTTGIGNP
jgi:hypothetical protein